MRVRLIPVALVAVGIFILSWAALSKGWRGSGENVAFCADCLGYVRDVDTMFQKNTGAWANSQFFRYALDKSCRGRVLITGRCLQYRRRLLKKPAIFMAQLDSPYEAYSTSQGRRSGIQRRQNLEICYTLFKMLSKIRNAASLKGGDPISSEIYLDLVTKTASEFSLNPNQRDGFLKAQWSWTMGAPLSNDNKYLKYVPPPEIRCQIYGYIFEPDRASIVSQSERKVEGSSREGSGLNYFIDNYGHVTRLHPAQPCFMSLPRAGPGFIIVPITTPIAHFSTQIEEALLILCGRQVTLQEIERASANVSRYMVYPQSYADQQTVR
ncbi:hypothetical protein AKAW_09013 [Aspergillus luchuensis IFO 4308]|nr:hypothetical protein AKAW_09013 [Aspergillus luchuensis IFO 4308]